MKWMCGVSQSDDADLCPLDRSYNLTSLILFLLPQDTQETLLGEEISFKIHFL